MIDYEELPWGLHGARYQILATRPIGGLPMLEPGAPGAGRNCLRPTTNPYVTWRSRVRIGKNPDGIDPARVVG
jgi:hypothetical protein